MDVPLKIAPANSDLEKLWQAILTGDESYIGQFFYGVRSTGVYCRPGCPSRKPGKAQVEYFSTCAEAEKAGYRPCKRCQPGLGRVETAGVGLVERACQILDSQVENPPGLEELSRALAVSPSHLHRLFKRVTGLTPHQYAAGRRLEKFKALARRGDSLSGAIYEAGYGSSSRLYEDAPDRLGMTPGSYQNGGKSMEIGFTIVDTFIGRMLVAATKKGVCAVSFGDEDKKLEAWLRMEFPQASLQRGDGAFSDWVNTLLSYLEGDRPHLELALDLQASAFQMRVWEELRRIPYGETRTYTEVANAIGRPKAVRAVANACAANPVAVVNPCHRVLRRDGSLGGYRWGIERKHALLDREKGAL